MSFPRSEAAPAPVEKSRPGAILGRPPAAVIRRSQRAVSHIGLPLLTALLVTLSAGAPAGAGGQQPTVEDSSSAAGLVRPTRPYPHVGGGRTVALLGTGAALQIAFRLVPITQRPISATGLDPAEILWSTDRAAVRRGSLHAESASDRTRDAAIALPLVLGLASTWRAPWPDVPLRGLVHAEAYLLSHGLTYLGKRAFGRPRP
ncbi:MAG TPA: hypothetical protein VLA09_10570, partial [Longimicrobiales bacterium]|nr:hypothetical protein [Longimicrobiales bacterium]